MAETIRDYPGELSVELKGEDKVETGGSGSQKKDGKGC